MSKERQNEELTTPGYLDGIQFDPSNCKNRRDVTTKRSLSYGLEGVDRRIVSNLH